MTLESPTSNDRAHDDLYGSGAAHVRQFYITYLSLDSVIYSAVDTSRWMNMFHLPRPLEVGTTLGRNWSPEMYRSRPTESGDDPLQVAVRDLSPETTKRMEDASAALDRLQELPPNWDSYGAYPISSKSIKTAFTIVREVILKGAPDPIIVPTSAGGIQLEWHNAKCDLEIEVTDDLARAFFALHRNPEQTWDGRLKSTGWHLDSLLARLQ